MRGFILSSPILRRTLNTALLLTALAVVAVGQPDPTKSFQPLTPGAVNLLKNYDGSAFFRFTVESALTFDDRRIGSLKFENPWITYSWLIYEDSSGTWFSGYAVGGVKYYFPKPSPLFPQGGTIGQSWSGDYAQVTLMSTGNTVTTPAGTFKNTSRFKVAMLNQGAIELTVAPGVGVIAVGPNAADLQLTSRQAGGTAPGQGAYPAACTVAGISAIPTDPKLTYTQRTGALKPALALQPGFNVSTIPWDELEAKPGVYTVSRIVDEMKLADANGLKKVLTIRTVDSGIYHMPSDLMGRAWNDPVVITRFAAAVNYLLSKLPNGVQWLHLGYEIEPYFTAQPGQISAYRAFISQSKALIKPNTKASIGLIFGFDATKHNTAVYSQFADLSDHISFDYYALVPSSTYTEIGETAPRHDIPVMLSLAGTKQVLITEAGYSSSTAPGGGLTQQASFFQNIMSEIRKTKGQIAAVNVWSLNDMPTSVGTTTAVDYGVSSTINVQFLTSLGLKTTTGTLKPAYSTVQTTFGGFKSTPSCSQ